MLGDAFKDRSLEQNDLRSHLEKLAGEIQKDVPSGLGRGRQMKFSIAELDKILEGGAQKLVEQGYGEAEDLENCDVDSVVDVVHNAGLSKKVARLVPLAVIKGE